MSIVISRQAELYGKTEREGQRPSRADRPEQKKKQAMEQMQRVGQSSVSDEVSVPDKVSKSEAYPTDQFIKSGGSSSTAGTYRLQKDGNGNSKIIYNKPTANSGNAGGSEAKQAGGATEKNRVADTSGKKGNPLVSAKKPEDKPNKAPGNSPADKSGGLECTVNTDQVDAEIRNLKKEKQQLEQEIKQADGDETKKKQLEERLNEVDNELQRKDNDQYRKQHAQYTYKK